MGFIWQTYPNGELLTDCLLNAVQNILSYAYFLIECSVYLQLLPYVLMCFT